MSKEKIDQLEDEVFQETKNDIATNILKSALERLVQESKWFTSIGLALLGFFTALLVQLKLAELQPLNFIAIVAIVALVISLGSGFWIKICSMRDDIGEDLKPVIHQLIVPRVKNKLNDINLSDIEEAADDEIKEKDEADQILESVTNALPNRLIILQGLSLFISIFTVFIYLMNFLL